MQSHHRSRRELRLAAVLACSAHALALPQVESVPGFAARAVTLPPAVRGWVGFDALPDGSLAAFDGQNLVALDARTGTVRKKLATLPAAVFGSDVRTGPTGQTVFFGESSSGGIYRHALKGGSTQRVTTLGGNFTLAFHPEEGERFLWASGHPGFTGTTKVFRIDTATGEQDLIAEANGFAGPIALDARGDLYFAPAPIDLRKPRQGRILRWRRSAVLAAIGPGHLGERDAAVFASGFDNAIDIAIDSEGTFYAADAFAAASSSLLEIGPGGTTRFASGVARYRGELVSSATFALGARPFERYGTAGAVLWLGTSDFQGSEHLIELAPRRPLLAAAPRAPRPGGEVRASCSGLPAPGFALWLLGAGLAPERPLLPLGAAGLSFPDFGIVLSAPFVLLPAPVASDARAELTVRAPERSGLPFTVQVLAGPVAPLPGGTAASPWVTSNPVGVLTR